jgi:hypothetical protein
MPEDVAVVITVAPEPPAAALLAGALLAGALVAAGVVAGAPVAGGALLLLLPLAHAATSTAVATPTPSSALVLASLADLRTGSCMLNLLPIIVSSPSATACHGRGSHRSPPA